MIHPIVSPRTQVRMMGLRSSRVALKPSHLSGALPSVHPPLRKGVWCCNRIANPTKYHQEGFNRAHLQWDCHQGESVLRKRAPMALS